MNEAWMGRLRRKFLQPSIRFLGMVMEARVVFTLRAGYTGAQGVDRKARVSRFANKLLRTCK